MMFAFLAFCTVDGSRERGAKIGLALRIRVDRELDEGDVEREERRERWGEAEAFAAVVAAVAIISSGLVVR